jgi:hypothetical protein
MPTFQGLVTEEQLLELIEYIKSLQPPAGTTQNQGAPGANGPGAPVTR